MTRQSASFFTANVIVKCRRWSLGLFPILLLILAACSWVVARAEEHAPSIVARCQTDLAHRRRVPVREVKVISAEETNWPDTALGLPEPGMMYAQVVTPGWKIMLEARNIRYLYTASQKAFKYAGPVAIWNNSLLYLTPTPADVNMNRELWQCSLLGTNSIRLVAGVSDYYPQAHGVILVKRRMSRSSHDLLYVNASNPEKERRLYNALDFVDAAVNETQDKWVAIARPGLGSLWTLVIASLTQENVQAQQLPLPDGIRPQRVAWSENKVFLQGTSVDETICFTIDPYATVPTWKHVPNTDFPGSDEFVLNKSETLQVRQVKRFGTPIVEVSRVWFTGDRTVIAKIRGITLRAYNRLGDYVIIRSERKSIPAIYTVNITTGEVIPGLHGNYEQIKPFAYPPLAAHVIPRDGTMKRGQGNLGME